MNFKADISFMPESLRTTKTDNAPREIDIRAGESSWKSNQVFIPER